MMANMHLGPGGGAPHGDDFDDEMASAFEEFLHETGQLDGQ